MAAVKKTATDKTHNVKVGLTDTEYMNLRLAVAKTGARGIAAYIAQVVNAQAAKDAAK